MLSLSISNATANLVIHPPWNSSNGVYDLLYCTNLSPPISWQWLLRTEPGQTNLTVGNETAPQSYYRLALPSDLVATSSLGTDFWVAFFSVINNGLGLSLYISSPVGATGTVTIPGFSITNDFSVEAGVVTNISIPSSIMMSYYDWIEAKGIHVTASQPVSVYGMVFSHFTSSSFTGYPTPLLGSNYCILSRPSLDDWPLDGDTHSQFAIVATADNTTVSIAPSATANLNWYPEPYEVTNLMQGETYQVASTDYTGDVTGTWIHSDKPVAVFAGANLAYVPNADSYSGNPLVQEQMPVDTWGTQVLALSYAARTNGASYRVLAAANDTIVFTNGVVAGTNQAAHFLDLMIDGPVEFRGSHPIQVAQFANGFTIDAPDTREGDPCGILLPPAGRYLQTNTVATLPLQWNFVGFHTNWLNIIAPQSALSNTMVDGSTVDAAEFAPIGTSGYYGTQLLLTNDVSEASSHTVISSQPVWVQIYGFGEMDAYSYFGGLVK